MNEEKPLELPPGLALLWGLRERSRRGPKPGLTVEDIVKAAVGIADADGLAAVSMARVAERLGFTTMSLYRYVESKDELLVLMTEHITGLPADRGVEDGWRPTLERWARANLAIYRRHPWLLKIPITGPPITPNQLLWLEWGLQALAGTGLSQGGRLAAMMALTGYVRGDAQLTHDMAQGNQIGHLISVEESKFGRTAARLVDADRYPALTEMLRSGLFDQQRPADVDATEADFAVGLNIVLDGIEAMVKDPSRMPGWSPESH